MKKTENETIEANHKINNQLEDSEIKGSNNHKGESGKTNEQIQQEFYKDTDAENAPTYMYNNTPAIKIDRSDEE